MIAEARSEYRLPRGYLSPSSINRWLSCPACFYLRYVEGRPAPTSVNLPLGGSVHYGVEHMRRLTLAGEPVALEEIIEAAAAHFDDEVGRIETLDLGKFGSAGAAKDQAVATLRFAAPRIARLDESRGLVATEIDLAGFENPFPFPMHGRIDALYGPGPGEANAGEDMKTAARAEMPAESIALQVGIYREVSGIGSWFVDQFTKTREPKSTTYELDDGEEGREYVWTQVLDVAARISEGYFPPRPSFLCDYAHGGPRFSVVTTTEYTEGDS